MRKQRGGTLATVVLATEGTNLKDPKAQAVQSVLRSLLGTGPRLKWCYEGSRLGKAVFAACKAPCHVSSLSITYTDSGLFGVQYVVDAVHSAATAKAVVSEFRKLASASSIDSSELEAARRRVKIAALEVAESRSGLLNDLATQALVNNGATYLDVVEANKLVDDVTAEDVMKLAKKAVSSKMSMAAVGNLSHTPYLDELMSS